MPIEDLFHVSCPSQSRSPTGRSPPRRAARKLDATANEVEDGGMPLWSYTWMHPAARLTPGQRKIIVDWAQALHDKILPE